MRRKDLITTSVVLKDSDKKELEKIAKVQHRSLSGLLRFIIEDYLRAE